MENGVRCWPHTSLHSDLICSFTCLRFTGPTGELVDAADDEEAVLLGKFDLNKIRLKRTSWGVFRDRRPDLYKVLLTLDGVVHAAPSK